MIGDDGNGLHRQPSWHVLADTAWPSATVPRPSITRIGCQLVKDQHLPFRTCSISKICFDPYNQTIVLPERPRRVLVTAANSSQADPLNRLSCTALQTNSRIVDQKLSVLRYPRNPAIRIEFQPKLFSAAARPLSQAPHRTSDEHLIWVLLYHTHFGCRHVCIISNVFFANWSRDGNYNSYKLFPGCLSARIN